MKVITIAIGLLTIIVTLLTGFKDEIFFQNNEGNGEGIDSKLEVESEKNGAITEGTSSLTLGIGSPPIFDALTKTFISISHVKNEYIEYYRINWSNDNGSGSEAIKSRSRIEIQLGNITYTIFIHSINKDNDSVNLSITGI